MRLGVPSWQAWVQGPRRLGVEAHLDVLRSVIETLPDAVAVVDEDGKFLLFNDVARRILGVGEKTCGNRSWSEISRCYRLDGTPFPTERLPLARSLNGERVLDEEMIIRNRERPDGIRIAVSSCPLETTPGVVRGGVALFRDVTHARRAAERVQQLSNAVEQTADSVMITNTTGAITYVNPAFERITGYTQAEALGNKPNLLKSGEHSPEFYEKLWTTILDGKNFRAAIANRRSDGSLYWAEQTITPMKNDRGEITHFVSVFRDLSERRRLQEQEYQMLLAQAVQRRFYFVEAELDGFEVAGRAFPALQTGGDYFDFIPLPDGRMVVAIGDVTGHGFGSALLMAELRAYIRALALRETGTGDILSGVNHILFRDLEDNRLITLLLLRLDPRRRTFSYASAGHVPGYVIGAGGGVRYRLGATGQPLGLFPDCVYPSSGELPLATGDVMTLMTDGITEAGAPDGKEFGAGGVLSYLRSHMEAGATEIIESLYRAAREHLGGSRQHDDITLVVSQTAADIDGPARVVRRRVCLDAPVAFG